MRKKVTVYVEAEDEEASNPFIIILVMIKLLIATTNDHTPNSFDCTHRYSD